ncbi:MAG: GTP 3',8-cyclase MoaA [Alphaproteobacteria bacterium]|nr:GTP 3',8-cyclase MoaA [Alphaproteobacteria bacterium]
MNKILTKNLSKQNILVDSHGRTINYLRLSVTDRCNYRCTYCMPEKMKFLPKKDLLTFEEMDHLCSLFIARGITNIRLSGGEPLVRKGILRFISNLSRYIVSGDLNEITLTTNGSQLKSLSEDLFRSGVRRVNVSLDSLSEEKFSRITRRDDLCNVIEGLEAAKKAGLKIKINTVVIKNKNLDEIDNIISWSHKNNFDISLIETMPMGLTDKDRIDQYISLSDVKKIIEEKLTLTDSNYKTSGPSKYYEVKETKGLIGFITPLSNNFCASCNRIRLTSTGKLYMCLGQNNNIDFRNLLREGDKKSLNLAIDTAMKNKPKSHDFDISYKNQKPAVDRHMSVTGG